MTPENSSKNQVNTEKQKFYGMENLTGTPTRLYGSPKSWFSQSRPVPQFLDNNGIANAGVFGTSARTVNGISETEWHSMSDHRRQLYLQEKRKNQAYKTGMCKDLARNGYCAYGETCRFAHSPSELRIRTLHPKYKTELCRNFALFGTCSYGSRCQFIHRSPSNFDNARQFQCSAPPAFASRTTVNFRLPQSSIGKNTITEEGYSHTTPLIDSIIKSDTAPFLSDYLSSTADCHQPPIERASGAVPENTDDYLAALLDSTFNGSGNPFCRSCFSTMPSNGQR